METLEKAGTRKIKHMDKPFIITTTTQWKALSHPLRAGILRILTERSLTNEELADTLGVESGKLHFHTRHLLDAGLIEMAATRVKGPITEKVYRAVARSFVANGLPDTRQDGEGLPPFDFVLSTMQSLYRQSWQNADAMTGGAHYAYHFSHRIPQERINEFVMRLKGLIQDFQTVRTADLEAPEYSFGVLLHPVPSTEPRKE